MNVIVLGDSLSFPRGSKGQTLEQAWPQRICSDTRVDVLWMRAREAATAGIVLEEARQVGRYVEGGAIPFDLAIVQVGIVDCSPRPLPRWLMKRMPRGRLLQKVVYRIGTRRKHPRPWVSPTSYASSMAQLATALLKFSKAVVMIEIAPPGPQLQSKLGDFSELVEQYNSALRTVAHEAGPRVNSLPMDPSTGFDTARHLLEDGHHLTSSGHAWLAIQLAAYMAHPNSAR